MGFDTVVNIVNDAAVELGLLNRQRTLVDPYASSDANIGQLVQLVKSVGRDLRRLKQWTFLQKPYTFLTVSGTQVYALPADFGMMIDQTGWSRTSRYPLTGPASPQEWQYLEAQTSGLALGVVFRPLQGQLELFNPPDAATIAFEYVSTYWVKPLGQSSPTTDAPSAKSDTLCFDAQLFMRALKLAWLRQKGLDYSTAQDDYERTLEGAMADDTVAAPVLGLNSRSGVRLIDNCNLPDTGYGS